ncbi:right-handed parallel beta-helix repeat-containing protein [bacterium]|nr:right-handed parallel beta-helix repeat-containing protein [bacterium]
MNIFKKRYLFIALFFIIFPIGAFAYEKQEPILIENIHATKENPYIIEGYEISSDIANCIEVKNSEHVIIRNNYLHDCTFSKDPNEPLSWTEGRAIVVKNSKDILIENNILLKNKIGIFAYKLERVKILHNDIRETQVVGSLKCEYCENSEIAFNYLLDNGRPDWFWVPGNRIIGIWVAASNNINIHDNTVIRSSSDGIGISGTIDSSLENPGKRDWKMVSKNVRVYNNMLLDNLELGIWLGRIKNMKCFNNTIRDHYGPIVLDFDIIDSEFYDNKLVSWGGAPIGIGTAKNNYIHDNIWYSIENQKFAVPPGDAPGTNDIKFAWSGIIPYSSSGNNFENNKVYQISGKLKETLKSKIKKAENEKIFKEKGWFACEIEEGLVDKECVKKEEAKGNQGMPRDLFVFEPLMENFDEFVVKKPFSKFFNKNEKFLDSEDNDSILDELRESWEATIIALFVIILIFFIIRYRIKKR